MIVMTPIPIGADDGPWEDTVDGVLHINDDWIHQDEIDAWREEVAPLWQYPRIIDYGEKGRCI